MKVFHTMMLAVGLVVFASTEAQSQQSQPQQHPQSTEAKWRIVNYWSEWCVPCRREIPMLNALNETLSSTNVTVVGVNFDEDPTQVTLSIAKDMGVDFPTLTIDAVSELRLRAPDVLPTTYILSPDNKVVAKLIGEQTQESLQAQLASLGLPVVTD